MKFILIAFLVLGCVRAPAERSVAQLQVAIHTDEANVSSCEAINTLAPVGCPQAAKTGCEKCLEEITGQARALSADTVLVPSKDTSLCAKQEFSALLFKCQK